jgi:hypothetical protein
MINELIEDETIGIWRETIGPAPMGLQYERVGTGELDFMGGE